MKNKASKVDNKAIRAAEEAAGLIYSCLDDGKSFVCEAGAGSGKTYSLIQALNYVIAKNGPTYLKLNKRIACITYTEIAKKEIDKRTDNNPLIHTATTHSFCWSLIKGFQPFLRGEIMQIPAWIEKIKDAGLTNLDKHSIEYDLGKRFIKENFLYLHHDDIIPLMINLLSKDKFKALLTSEYPVILIDEYQDTNALFMNAIKESFFDTKTGPIFGLFGDHWQMIYDDVCGEVTHENLMLIQKRSNFRSSVNVVNLLNSIRDNPKQEIADDKIKGQVSAYHTNNFSGVRRTGSHWIGDLPDVDARAAYKKIKMDLTNNYGWDFNNVDSTKVLMLTHNVLAEEQGYKGLIDVFKYKDSVTKKEDPYIEFFVDRLEPAIQAYKNKKYALMFEILKSKGPLLKSHSDKVEWAIEVETLIGIRENSKVVDVINFIKKSNFVALPSKILKKESVYQEWFTNKDNKEIGETLMDETLIKLYDVKYEEVINFSKFSNEHTPFSTQHGVKGSEFENVLVVIGRGWSKYNFDKMISWKKSGEPFSEKDNYERSRNLFYVCCSRAKKNLVVLFTQQLSINSIRQIEEWFGSNVHDIGV